MSGPGVYVAAPYDDAAFVRDVVHPKLVELGTLPMSQWAEKAAGPEDFSKMTVDALRAAARENDRDLRASAIVLVIARAGAGGEMFSEARLGVEWGKALVWVGRRTLSAWRTGVVRVDTLDAAFDVLVRMVVDYREGARGHLLASLAAQVQP